MVGWIGPFILDMEFGLSSPSPVWSKSLDQGSSVNMDETPEAREKSFYKPKYGQQDEQIGCQGLHHGSSDYCTDIIILCD